MSFHDHALSGCTSRPLVNYLKALAVLRLVAEQKDPLARGYWRNEIFHLVTYLDEHELCRFFLEEWQPTGIVTPWRPGSGFYSDKDKGLKPLEQSTAERFFPMRQAIASARSLTDKLASVLAIQRKLEDEAKLIKDAKQRAMRRSDPTYKKELAAAKQESKRLKDSLQAECQRQWRGGELRWLRASSVIESDGKVLFPDILGKGGNDGNFEFSNNAYQRLADLFEFHGDGQPKPQCEERLLSSLWGLKVPGLLTGTIGLFSPALSGGANTSSAAIGKSQLNPWDLLLLLEGAILFTAGATKRLLAGSSSRAAAPFAVIGQNAGYGSASRGDGESSEQWMPLWENPSSLTEIQSVLIEGRSQIGNKPSQSSIDIAGALARTGVARGISSFERYAYLKRNGDNSYAVPVGRWKVQPDPKASLLEDLERDGWWEHLRRAVRPAPKGQKDLVPSSLVRAERNLADATLAALANSSESRWANVMVALSRLEAQMLISGSFTVQKKLSPIPRLSPAWIDAVNDGSSEFRLALCLAGAGTDHSKNGRPIDSVRSHWLPLKIYDKHADGRRFFRANKRTLETDTRVVVYGRDPETDLLAMIQRRLLESTSDKGSLHGRRPLRRLPIQARPGTEACPCDIESLISGTLDLERLMLLARAFSALDWSKVSTNPFIRPNLNRESYDPPYMALRLSHLPWKRLKDWEIPTDPAALRLLISGDVTRAFDIIIRRLASSGIVAPISVVALSPRLARLYASSLAFPISYQDALRFVRVLDPNQVTTKEP